MLLPRYHGAHSSCVSTSSNHAEISNLELDAVLDFVGCQVQLDAVVNLGVRVWVTNGPAITGVQVRDTLRSGDNGTDTTQFVGSLRGSDPVHGEPSLHVVDDSEVLSGLFNLHHVHEPSWELRISPCLSINLHQTLFHNGLDLLHVQGVFQTIPEE